MPKINRRELTFASLSALAAQAQGGVEVTHGPFLGHVTDTQINIWGRTARPGELRVRFGTSPKNLDQVSSPVVTTADHDCASWIRISGLKPDTRYYYALSSNPDHAGTFRTLPDAAMFRHDETNPGGLFNFRFEFGSCNNQKPGSGMGPGLPAFRHMIDKLRDSTHFSILNGDWLYEDKREYPVDEWRKQIGLGSANPAIVDLAPSITGVWENYKFFLERGKNMAAWHKVMPGYFTPDDHEILNDVYGTGSAGVKSRRAVFRDIAMRAWFDYIAGSNPLDTSQQAYFGRAALKSGDPILVDRDADFLKLDMSQALNLHVHWGGQMAGVDGQAGETSKGDPNAGVYEVVEVLDRNRLRIRPTPQQTTDSVFSIGRHSYGKFRVANVEFYLLDTRSLRDQHDPKNPNRKGLSMIGKRQREWLMRSMKESDAQFFFLASSVNLMIPHVGSPGSSGPIAGKDDAWTAFMEEREMLIDFWKALNKPVIVMTGDLHNSFAVKVTDKVWEFCSGPHNSANHPAKSEGGRPPNGSFDSHGRKCEIRWSTYFSNDVPAPMRRQPVYAVAQVNNIFSNPLGKDQPRWIAFDRPHVVIQYYDGVTGDLMYAESIHA